MVKRKASRHRVGDGKFESVLASEERALAKKFHDFLTAWQTHIREEIVLHKQMDSKRHGSLKRHVKDTMRIHERFLKQLKKL